MPKSKIFSLLPALILAILIAFLLNGGLRILNVWISPTERVLRTTIFVTILVQIGLLVMGIIWLVAGLSKLEFDETIIGRIIVVVMFAIAAVLSARGVDGVVQRIKLDRYADFVAEHQPLLAAIQQYEDENGRWPEDLSDISAETDFITATGDVQLPITTIDEESAAGLNYVYATALNENDPPWELNVTINRGSFRFTIFSFNPNQSYPDADGTLNEWGYLRID